MIGRDRFLRTFPEFSEVEIDTIDQALADAEPQVDPVAFGTLTDRAHGLTAASILARSPAGQASRMTSKDGVSTYDLELVDLRRVAACMLRVFR